MEILLQLNRGDGGGVFAMEGEAGGMIDRFWFFLCFSDPRAMEGRFGDLKSDPDGYEKKSACWN